MTGQKNLDELVFGFINRNPGAKPGSILFGIYAIKDIKIINVYLSIERLEKYGKVRGYAKNGERFYITVSDLFCVA